MTAARTRPLVAVIISALALSLGGCTFGGDEVNMETNLANQRKAAELFLESRRGIEKIRFTQDGGKPGLGAGWGANAVVTVGGSEYQAILGLLSISNEPLPSVPPDWTQVPVIVTYSDGSSEVIE
ncbi:hypothetical protein ABCS02_05390 [Microbacterium sp. X-17]|uniref:hypothetical protein n=1 Tax=Microbacterium sp. X-17 TaxID=3144404 RepID=UPI0031F5CE73